MPFLLVSTKPAVLGLNEQLSKLKGTRRVTRAPGPYRGRENARDGEDGEGGEGIEGKADEDGEDEGQGAEATMVFPVLELTEMIPAAVPYIRTKSSSRAFGWRTENKSWKASSRCNSHINRVIVSVVAK